MHTQADNMVLPRWFIPFDVFVQLTATLVTVAVSLYALRAYRQVGDKSLYALFLCFLLLALASFADAMTGGYAILARLNAGGGDGSLMLQIGFWAYYLLTIAAYAILLAGYWKNHREVSIVGAVAVSALISNPGLELMVIILLLAILIVQLTKCIGSRNENAWLVAFSFGLLLVAHTLILLGAFAPLLYAGGMFIELGGFICLLLVLWKVRLPA
jgi:hypothetical protein